MSCGNSNLQKNFLTLPIIIIEYIQRSIVSFESTKFYAISTIISTCVFLAATNQQSIKLNDCYKATKFVNDATNLSHIEQSLKSIFFNGHNIIMLVEMLATGLPFVGWKVKPDPGD